MNEKIIFSLKSVHRESLDVKAFCFGNLNKKTICIIGAMRGNEVQQMYVCAKLVKRLKKLESENRISPDTGIMVIPCVNNFSMNINKRFWPMDNTDINRMFPGYDLGETTQRIADGIFKKIQGYEYGIQLASFYQPGSFITHVKHMVTEFTERKGLEDFGLPYAVERTPRPYDTTTLNYNWQLWDTKAYSLFTQSTDDINENSAVEALDAMLRFMSKKKMITYPIHPGFVTKIVKETDMVQLHSPTGGICKMKVKIGDVIKENQVLAKIIDPLTSEVKAEIKSPCRAVVFFEIGAPLVPEGIVAFKLVKYE